MSVVQEPIRSNKLVSHIQWEIDNDRLILPTLPDVALKVREAISSGTATTGQLVEIIGSDAALSARLLKITNSPLYRGRVEIEKLSVAVARLGMDTVRNLVTSIVLKQMFKPKTKQMENCFRKIWQHSVNVSSISRALASRCPHLDPDQAMLAGLIHQIGKLPILMCFENNPELIDDDEEFENILENLHSDIGKMIMLAWDFPESLIAVVSEYKNYQRNTELEADYVDLVQVAHLETTGGQLEGQNNNEFTEISAFARLGLAPEIEVLEIEGVAEEMEEAQLLLG